MTKRTKNRTVVPPTDLHQAEAVMAQYARADAKIEQINSEMDQEFARIREEHSTELQELQEKRELCFKQMQMYAESNPDHFKKKRSFPMTQGMIGFRTGTPKLKTARGFTWASVLELLKVKLPEYVRTKEEPVKTKLLADRENPTIKAALPGVGLEVVQDETFFIELKKEELELA